MSGENQGIGDSTDRELAALAEGSLQPGRAQALLARAQREPLLAARLAAQRRALELEAVAHGQVASTELQREVALMNRAATTKRARPGRSVLLGGLLAAGGACAAALIIALGSASEGTPKLSQAAALARAVATLPAPKESPSDGRLLSASEEGVTFPYWGEHSAWQPSGARRDRLSGRAVETVFYSSRGGGRIGYAIVSGGPLAVSGGEDFTRKGVNYRSLRMAAGNVLTWVQDGHTCVLVGKVSTTTLLHLAALS